MESIKYVDVVSEHGWCDEHALSHIVTLRAYRIYQTGVLFVREVERCLI